MFFVYKESTFRTKKKKKFDFLKRPKWCNPLMDPLFNDFSNFSVA